MRDALGGSVNVIIIVVFIVFVMGYMAFNVNYTKAFRMKNKIIALYEEYEGECESSCYEQIEKYARNIGYFPDSDHNFSCPSGYYARPDSGNKLYCEKEVAESSSSANEDIFDETRRRYFKIITKISISIPVLDNMMSLNVFQVTGDTKAMKIKNP